MPRDTKNIDTRTVLIIQHIHISWTKAARGGNLAERRSRIAHAYPLTKPPATYDKHDHYIVHRIDFGERNRFSEPIRQETSAPNTDTPFRATNCTVEFNNGTPNVTYEWRDGAPPRQYVDNTGTLVPIKKSLTVTDGQCGRIEYNGRFTGYDCGNWWYEHSIINIAYTAFGDSELFLTTEPNAECQQLASLW